MSPFLKCHRVQIDLSKENLDKISCKIVEHHVDNFTAKFLRPFISDQDNVGFKNGLSLQRHKNVLRFLLFFSKNEFSVMLPFTNLEPKIDKKRQKIHLFYSINTPRVISDKYSAKFK